MNGTCQETKEVQPTAVYAAKLPTSVHLIIEVIKRSTVDTCMCIYRGPSRPVIPMSLSSLPVATSFVLKILCLVTASVS
jgi:hypothetical protein